MQIKKKMKHYNFRKNHYYYFFFLLLYRLLTRDPRSKKIFLYSSYNHYDTIVNMQGFHGRSYYCVECDTSFDHVENHKCCVRCNVCFRKECVSDTKQVCPLCHRTCQSLDCFHSHRVLNGKQKKLLRAIL